MVRCIKIVILLSYITTKWWWPCHSTAQTISQAPESQPLTSARTCQRRHLSRHPTFCSSSPRQRQQSPGHHPAQGDWQGTPGWSWGASSTFPCCLVSCRLHTLDPICQCSRHRPSNTRWSSWRTPQPVTTKKKRKNICARAPNLSLLLYNNFWCCTVRLKEAPISPCCLTIIFGAAQLDWKMLQSLLVALKSFLAAHSWPERCSNQTVMADQSPKRLLARHTCNLQVKVYSGNLVLTRVCTQERFS